MSDKQAKGIYITQFDLKRLRELIKSAKPVDRDRKHLNDLEDELSRAKLVDPKDVPEDVITMNSKFSLEDLDSGERMTFALSFPADADPEEGSISVLAPIGTAVIGYRVGDTIEWEVPAGKRRFRVRKLLYQPEAAGDYNL
ncbi:MAG: nucleoside diphosphate kinase regulator [Actinobacteria bacterium]|nr:nucleoside diphosphate kinase regulator [Actinomycetota bacterium]